MNVTVQKVYVIMKKFNVLGMSCSSCANSLEAILKNLPSTKSVTVHFTNHTLYLDSTNYSEAKQAAKEIGYELQDLDFQQMNLKIGGISCASCVASIEQVLSNMEEVNEISVSLPTKTAYIEFHGNKQKIIDKIHEIVLTVN